jgi:2-oxoisovalerate dehydrogenase E2 component (dihydrolipoyl transacylase)
MGEHTIKLPDVGEGVAEAELVEWMVKIGDIVREDSVLGAVMTDKATVEIPSPVEGEVVWLGGEVGDTLAVGAPLIRLKVAGEGTAAKTEDAATAGATPTPNPSPQGGGESAAEAPVPRPASDDAVGAIESPSPLRGGARGGGRTAASGPRARPTPGLIGAPRAEGDRPLAPPAVRLRAKDSGVDLRQVAGSGPAGRITHEDLDAFIARGPQKAPAATGLVANTDVTDIKVIGLRRKIAEKMAKAKQRIPHITYVEEIDVTALEDLRAQLNKNKRADQPKLTILPFLMRAMVKAIADHPEMNALFDDDAGVIHQHGGVHIGMAAQTRTGLVVAVVHHAEARDLWECAAEVNRLADAAKAGTATREELSGSTITITSLGAIGGVVTTPVINYPEVAIVGVNKIMMRPMWDGASFQPRKMMNLSSGFDHRVIDGWNAAQFIQRVKTLLETPAMIFV